MIIIIKNKLTSGIELVTALLDCTTLQRRCSSVSYKSICAMSMISSMIMCFTVMVSVRSCVEMIAPVTIDDRPVSCLTLLFICWWLCSIAYQRLHIIILLIYFQ